MPGALAWGYYPTDKIWLPIQVDSAGRIKADMSAINLDDLGDVSVASPTDGFFVYWDAATSLWKCRALVDADIPATIARDAEVATAISDHAALTTGVHGVGLDYIAKSSVDGLDLASHQSRHQFLGADRLLILANLLNAIVGLSSWTTRDAWTDYLTGSGSISWDAVLALRAITGATSDSIAAVYTGAAGSLSPHSSGYPFGARIQMTTNPADSEFWVTARRTGVTAASFPSLTEAHIGWRILNGRIYASNGNGTNGTQTDTGIDLAQWGAPDLLIVGTGATEAKFYVNRVLKATHTTNFPAAYNFFCWLGGKNTAASEKGMVCAQVAWGRES